MRRAGSAILAGTFLLMPLVVVAAPSGEKPATYRTQLAMERAAIANDRGVDFYLARKYKEAISAFGEALKLDPRNVEAYSNRGAAYDALHNHEKAISDYSCAIKMNPKLLDAYANRAAAYSDLGKYKQAADDYSKLIRFSPRRSRGYVKRGNMYKRLGQLERALEDYDKAVSLNQNDKEALKNRDALARALHKDEAEDQSATAQSDNGHSLTGAPGDSATATSPTQTVAVSQPAAATVKPKDEHTEQPLSKTVPKSQQSFEVVAPPKVADQAKPVTSKLAVQNEIQRSFGQETVDLATNAPGKSLETVSTNVADTNQLAASPRDGGIFGAASNVCYHILGNLMAAVGNAKGAIECYSAAAKASATDPFAYYRRANCYLQSGQYSLALADYTQALTLHPTFFQAKAKLDSLKNALPAGGDK